MSNNIADESARARKILAKSKPTTLSAVKTANVAVGQVDPRIGEFACLCLVGPTGPIQYTICRPIGITDCPADSWILIPTDQVLGTLARSVDPKQGEINRKRREHLNAALVKAGLLTRGKGDGPGELFYPMDLGLPRNLHLGNARKLQKQEKRALNSLKEEKRRLSPEEAIRLQQADDLIGFLPEECRPAEREVRKFLSDPANTDGAAKAFPQKYRTQVGTYGDQPQKPIRRSTGKRLVEVVSMLHKKFLSFIDE